MLQIVFGKVVLVASLAVDRPFGEWLRVNIKFAQAVDYDMGVNVACAVFTIGVGTDQSLMPRKIGLCIFHADGLRPLTSQVVVSVVFRIVADIDGVLDLNPEKVKQCMDAGLLQYRKRANEIVAHLMAKDDERTAVYREYEQGSISLEQIEEYEHQYQVAVQKQEAAFKKVMLAVNDIEKAFSHGNPWLMKFRAISIPETLERTHLKEWLDHVWIVDFEQVEVILQESEWKRFFPEEWLNNGEEDCNGKKE